MSIKASIYHLTHYRYDRPVVLGPQVIRLRPAPHSRTRVLSHSLKVTPSDHFVNHQQDPYGNWLSRFVFPEPVTELKIEVDLVADMTVYNPFDFFVEDPAEHWPFDYPEDLHDDLVIYRRPEPVGPRLAGVPRHHPARAGPHRRLRRRPQRPALPARSATSSAWSPACRRPRRPSSAAPAPAATPPGCSCRSCATSASPPASSPAT